MIINKQMGIYVHIFIQCICIVLVHICVDGLCLCMCICICVCVYVFVYVYMYIHMIACRTLKRSESPCTKPAATTRNPRELLLKVTPPVPPVLVQPPTVVYQAPRRRPRLLWLSSLPPSTSHMARLSFLHLHPSGREIFMCVLCVYIYIQTHIHV